MATTLGGLTRIDPFVLLDPVARVERDGFESAHRLDRPRAGGLDDVPSTETHDRHLPPVRCARVAYLGVDAANGKYGTRGLSRREAIRTASMGGM